MNQSFKQCLLGGGLGVALLASALLVGCGSDDNDSPSQPTVTGGTGNSGGSNSGSGGKGGKGGTGSGAEGGDDGSGGANDSGGSNNSGGTSNSGGSNNSGGTGGTEQPTQDCEAEEVDGCWICPQEPEHFLTQCTDSECEPFDNEERIPHLNEDGTVPDVLP